MKKQILLTLSLNMALSFSAFAYSGTFEGADIPFGEVLKGKTDNFFKKDCSIQIVDMESEAGEKLIAFILKSDVDDTDTVRTFPFSRKFFHVTGENTANQTSLIEDGVSSEESPKLRIKFDNELYETEKKIEVLEYYFETESANPYIPGPFGDADLLYKCKF